MTWSAVILRCASGLSVMKTFPELVVPRPPPVKAITSATAGSALTTAANWLSRRSMDWNDVLCVFDAFVTRAGSDQFVNLTAGHFPQLFNEDVRNVGFSGDGGRVWIRVADITSPASVWTVREIIAPPECAPTGSPVQLIVTSRPATGSICVNAL